ncbi:hypothetical protein Q3G72_018582 [Acer saccharum]|nr:hypothetical protein Q3G72_018582 [Acer saccharum]
MHTSGAGYHPGLMPSLYLQDQRNRGREIRCQSLRNLQDLAQRTGQGHGNRQHNACHTILDFTDYRLMWTSLRHSWLLSNRYNLVIA